MKSVLSVRRTGEAANISDSREYQEGQAKGLKSLQFTLVDTPPDIHEMEPMTYKAAISNAKGFLLVCSFDQPESIEFIEDRFNEIQKARNGMETPIVIIANKHELEESEGKVVKELDVGEVAARLHVKWCCSSMSSQEGCHEMSQVMLNEINMAAEQEEYLNSIPEDQYMYCDEMVEEEDDYYG